MAKGKGKPNPLKMHAIVLIVVGGVMLMFGAWSAISRAMEGGVQGMLRGAQQAQMQSRSGTQMGSMAGSATRMPTSIGAATAQVSQIQNLFRMVGRILNLGMPLLIGIVTVMMGVMMLKQKEWARLGGFACFGFGVLYVSGSFGVNMAVGGVVLPLLGVLIIAGIGSVFLWQLMTEKLSPA